MKYIVLPFIILKVFSAFGQNNTFPTSGNVGVGTTNPVKKLEVTDVIRSTSNFAGFESIHNSGTSYRWTLNNDNAFYLQSSTDKFIANATSSIVTFPDGNVAINSTTNNGYKLNVNGIASFTGGIVGIFNSHPLAVYSNDRAKNISFRRQISGEGDTNGIAHFGYNGSNYSLGIVEKDNGRIGIGIHDPSEKLSVNGRIYINNSDARFHLYNAGAVSEWLFGQKSASSHNFTFSQLVGTNETDRLTIATNGFVGIGKINPQAHLDVAGTTKVEENFILESNVAGNPKNAWIFHNPGDGRTTLHIAPMNQLTSQWDWSKQTIIDNNGNALFAGSVKSSNGGITSAGTDAGFVFTDRSNVAGGFIWYSVSDVARLWSGSQAQDVFRISNDGAGYFDKSLTINASSIPQDYKLAVGGNIIAEKVKVKKRDAGGNWPDFVFASSYKLPNLSEVESFIKQNSHLPEIPSAAEIEKDGQDLGEMNRLLLKKVEELTLYIISQEKKIMIQEREVLMLKKHGIEIEKLKKEITEIKQLLTQK